MTQEEIQIIIDSDIPSFLKSALIKSLIDLKNESARMFKEGGEVKEKSEPKWVKSDLARTEGDTIYYTDDESKDHEYYGHYVPNQDHLILLKPFYENLNDERLVNEFGADLDFVKRLDGDPGYFYSPEELLGRVAAASRFLKRKGITEITPEFLTKARELENDYGYNFRDLLHMYNDDNLLKMNIMLFLKGGKTAENGYDNSEIISYIKENYPILSNLADSTIIASNKGDIGKNKSYWLYVDGDIEFVPANLESNFGVEVRDEDGNVIEYNPYPGKRSITYNPSLALNPDKLKNAVAMDLLSHGLREDPEYVDLFNQLKNSILESDSKWDVYNRFGEWLQKHGNDSDKKLISEYKGDYIGDLLFDVLQDGSNTELLNSFSRFSDIYVDGLVRNFLSKNRETYHATPEQAKKENLKSDDSKKAWENLNNYIFKKLQGGTLDMTLEDILKLNISQSAKDELTRAFAEGGSMDEKTSPTLPEPEAVVTVGGKQYKVCIADTEEKRRKGLSKCPKLPEDGGMLFVFEEPSTTYFTMAETSIDLDIIFIDEEGEVIEVHSVKAKDPNPVQPGEEYAYVLEVNYGSGVLEGDSVEMQGIDEEEDDEEFDGEYTDDEKNFTRQNRMLMLDENGDVQFKLQGGERICSRIFSRKLIKAAIKAYREDTETAYRKVGKMIMGEFLALDNRQPQFVSAPEKKGEKDGE